MPGKEYLKKKLGYIRKLSGLMIGLDIFYFYIKWVIVEPAVDIESVFVVFIGLNVISASLILNQVRDLLKSIK